VLGGLRMKPRKDRPGGGSGGWLIVVREDQAGLYGYLREGFEGVPVLEVILDRRRLPTGFGDDPVEADQAAVDRRRPASSRERDRWRTFGYRLIARN